jgi:thiamine-phosphate pyrophosphorylase
MLPHTYTDIDKIASLTGAPGFQFRPCAGLPSGLLVFTDPKRGPGPLALAKRLPKGAGLVYRHFGAKDRQQTARQLREICDLRQAKLLIGADPELAHLVRADGVHVPERDARNLAAILRTFGFSLISAAAHSSKAAKQAISDGADLVVLSCVFASQSPSAKAPMGSQKFAAACQDIAGPVFGLGGIGLDNVHQLHGAGAGVAVVSAAFS